MDKEAKTTDKDTKSKSKASTDDQQAKTTKSADTKPTTNKTTVEKSDKKSPVQTIALVIAIIAGIALIGLYFLIDTENNSDVSSGEVEEEEVIETKCSIADCMTKIDVEDSNEKITEIIGVEPEIDESGNKAKWVFSSKENITREKSSGSSQHTVQATIDKTKIKNGDLDFSIFTELKEELESGESFTYDELVKRLGGVQGTLAGLTSTSKRYIWVDNHNQTFSATFSNRNGECSIISLR